MDQRRFFNEQYILQAFLAGNRFYRVIWAGAFMRLRHPDRLAAAFPSFDPGRHRPGSFWIQRIE
jgi:hypothetical protein